VKQKYWLFAFGEGSSYTSATVLAVENEGEAQELGMKVALREFEHRPGVRLVERIITDPKSCGLYDLLLPEAKAMIDIHWKNKEAVSAHWNAVIAAGSRNPVKKRQAECP
jgi:hypothetical protein